MINSCTLYILDISYLPCLNFSRENLKLMRELNDTAAQGRACGNLGNTYYLLGDFQQAIRYHEEVAYTCCSYKFWFVLVSVCASF